MPYGTGLVARTVLINAKPWQRYVIAIAMIVGGVALAISGHLAGSLLSIGGIVLLSRMLSAQRRARLAHRSIDGGEV
jgi:hypothetical protein